MTFQLFTMTSFRKDEIEWCILARNVLELTQTIIVFIVEGMLKIVQDIANDAS